MVSQVQVSHALQEFAKAVDRFYSSPLRKLFFIGPWRFVYRSLARLLTNPSRREVDLFFGGRMTVVLPEVVSEQIYTYGFFDEVVTYLALSAVREGDTVVDIGAHFGYFTLLFSHLVGGAGRVIAVEPTPSTCAILRENVVRVPNVTVLNAAAGSNAARMQIADFGLKHCAWNTLVKPRMSEGLGSPQRIEVEVMRLDDWLDQAGVKPNVIKIDAENFEAEVVAGLRRTIKNYTPRVIMETGSEAAAQAGEWLLAHEYIPYVSKGPGVLGQWRGSFREANERYKDILFVPHPCDVRAC